MMSEKCFIALHTSVETVEKEEGEVVRVVKTDKLYDFDTNSYAKLSGSDFHNGEIEVDVCSRLLPDAPDLARGFIGIAFRIAEDDGSFESFYLRPTNGRCNDAERKKHASQYFSYPTYTFQYFRKRNIEKYEASADIGLDEWIHMKIVIREAFGELYVNGKLTLSVDDMKLGIGARGAVGLFVDIGTEGFFRNLKITCAD